MLNKIAIKDQYWNHEIAYDYAIELLMKLGFTQFAADQFLFAEG